MFWMIGHLYIFILEMLLNFHRMILKLIEKIMEEKFNGYHRIIGVEGGK